MYGISSGQVGKGLCAFLLELSRENMRLGVTSFGRQNNHREEGCARLGLLVSLRLNQIYLQYLCLQVLRFLNMFGRGVPVGEIFLEMSITEVRNI